MTTGEHRLAGLCFPLGSTGQLTHFLFWSPCCSHLVNIPPGPHILSDVLLSSPIIAGEDGAPAGFGASAGGAGFEFGVDPSLDPELALALRISLEEERARQEAMTRAQGGGASGEASGTDAVPAAAGATSAGEVDDALAQALALSQGQLQEDVPMEDLSEEEQIARAIALSMGEAEPPAVSGKPMGEIAGWTPS